MTRTPRSDNATLVFHDNFAQMGGAERVAEELHRMLQGSDLATTLYVKSRLTSGLQNADIAATWMQHLPWKQRLFRWYFLLYPLAIEGVNLDRYALVVSSCFGYAKGLKRRVNAVHICYCHTPMRWVWRTSDYLAREDFSIWKTALLELALKPLRAWEIRASGRPDFYIANSQIVADRLMNAFGVRAVVIPPPIDTERFRISNRIDEYYLVLSRLVPYKRIDLAIGACSRTGRRLKIVGSGPDIERLSALAGPTVEFLGRESDEVVADLASRCRGLIAPGEEDFGMTPLEVNAAGRPVVAFWGGGYRETVVPGLNGVFFRDATVDSLIAALDRLESTEWNSDDIVAHAKKYDKAVFQKRIRSFIEEVLQNQNLVSPEND